MFTTTPLYHKITTIIRVSWGYAQERAMQVIKNNTNMEKKYYLSDGVGGELLEINEAQAAYIEANNERLEREVTNWWAYKQLVYETTT